MLMWDIVPHRESDLVCSRESVGESVGESGRESVKESDREPGKESCVNHAWRVIDKKNHIS